MRAREAKLLRAGTRGLAAVGVFFFVVTVRVVVASRGELAAGDALVLRGELGQAVAHYRRAARWYAPLSPYPVRALESLELIAERAEAEGDTAGALSAWRAIRAAILATRSFYIPHEDRLAAADRRIAALMAAGPPPPIDAELTQREREAEYFELLERPLGPSIPWSIAALAGFVAWAGAAFAFSHRAIDSGDGLVPKEARRWAAVWALGFALFCVGLAFA